MQRNLVFLATLSLFAAGVGLYVFKQSVSSPTIRPLFFGIASGYAPFISTNEKGEYEGFDIDVSNAIGKTLNKKVIFKDLGSMTSLLLTLEQGSIEAVIWGLEITEDRLKKWDMIRYQGQDITSYPLIFWNTIPEGISSLSDMQGMTICVEPGSSQNSVLEKYPSLTLLPVEHVDDALFNLQYGKATAAFVEPIIAQKFKKAYPQIKILLIPLDSQDQVKGIGIAIKKNNSVAREEIERALKILQENGSIAALEQKWGLS